MRDYFNDMSRSHSILVLDMVDSGSHRHIGNVSLQGIHWIDRTAEFAILTGERDHWDKSFGKEAAALMCQHAFQGLNLNRVHCATTEENVAMQKLAEHLGMKEEGRRRSATFLNGKYQDIPECGVLREEFAERTMSDQRCSAN